MSRRRDSTQARWHSTLAGLRVSADRWLAPELRAWIDAEQTLVHRRVDRRLLEPGTVDAVPPEWRPEARARLLFPSVWLRDAELIGRAPRGLVRTRRGRREALFVWHPAGHEKVASFVATAERGPRFFGAVTSSSRTVLLWPAEAAPIAPFFAKLSLPLEVAGAPRLVDRAHVCQAVEASALLTRLDTSFSFVAEPFGVVPATAPDASFIVREVPAGRWVPFFTFTAAAKRAPRLLDALVDAWLEAALGGLALEAHAQNVLVAVDARGRPTGKFGFRDLDGVTVDANALARAQPALAPVVDRLVEAGSPLVEEPDEALAQSFHRFLLGGPAFGFRGGQQRAIARLGARLGVDASVPEEVVAAVHVQRAHRLRPPRPPRWLESFLARDQGLNDRVRAPTLFAPVDLSPLPRAYDPATHPVWPVDALELVKSEVDVLGARSRASVQRVGDRYRLFVHPFMRTRLGLLTLRPLRRTRFFASPTSSPRTLALWSARGAPFAVKVSLDVELLGLSRLVHGSKLRRAVAIDRCVSALPPRVLRKEQLSFLREPEALRVRERDDGQLVRRLDRSLGQVLPGFGLFAKGGLLDAVPRDALLDTLERWVLRPLARVSAFLFFEEGLIGQLHQQNVLFALGRDGTPTGKLVLRDLDAFTVDERVRRARRRSPARVERRADVEALYDRAWGHSCRADFGFLAERLLERRGLTQRADELYRRFDVAFFTEAVRHLGEPLVRAELEWVRRRSPTLADRATPTGWSFGRVLTATSPQAFFFDRDRRQIGYSINALTHAWLRSMR